MGRLGVTYWDQVEARRLWDANEPVTAIGRAVGTNGSQIACFAGRHWPNRDKAAVVQVPRVTDLSPEVRSNRQRAAERRNARGKPTLPPLPSLAD